jgi:hypothetical protein
VRPSVGEVRDTSIVGFAEGEGVDAGALEAESESANAAEEVERIHANSP